MKNKSEYFINIENSEYHIHVKNPTIDDIIIANKIAETDDWSLLKKNMIIEDGDIIIKMVGNSNGLPTWSAPNPDPLADIEAVIKEMPPIFRERTRCFMGIRRNWGERYRTAFPNW